jgi:aspartyl-tRNA(Asn)/glutamyl-tRNA(Gln) amidotransferase subunit A
VRCADTALSHTHTHTGHRSDDTAGIDDGSTHAYAATRSSGFGAEAQRRILLGTYALTADAFDNYFLQAQRTRLRIQHDFDSVLRLPSVLRASPGPAARDAGVDVLLSPSSVRTAPTLESMLPTSDGAAPPQGAAARASPYVQDVLTVPASLAGLPALSVPAGVAQDGWPVGVSLTTQWGCEELLWRVGEALEPER